MGTSSSRFRASVAKRRLVPIIFLVAGAVAAVWICYLPSDKRALAACLGNPLKRQRAYEALLAHWAELYGQKGTRGSVQRVIKARTPSSGKVYVVLASLGRAEWSTLMLYLVREDGSLIEPSDESGFGTRESLTVLDLNGDGWQEIVGVLNGERLADGTLHDRLFVVRVDDPPEPILQLSFNRTGEVAGGRASWRLRKDKATSQHHIELYRRDWREEERVLVTFVWESASQTFAPRRDTGEIKWYLLPPSYTPERSPDSKEPAAVWY